MHLDASGSFRDTGEHRRVELACPTLHNAMLLQIFGHFSVIFRSFSEFQVLFTCLDALRSSRDTEDAK